MVLGRSSISRRFISILCAVLLFVPSGFAVPLQAAAQGAAHFKVDARNNQVWGHEWTPYGSVTVTIGEPGNPDHQETAQVDEGGNWGLWGIAYDIEPGDAIWVDDGTTTKDTEVTSVTVTAVNAGNDTISGTAVPWTDVQVIADGASEWRWVTADGAGVWTASFETSVGIEPQDQARDILPNDQGYALQRDPDSDETCDRWRAYDPHFKVKPEDNGLFGHDWLPSADMTVTIGDLGDPAFQGTTMSDGNGDFYLWDLGSYDLVAGDVVTVTDGTHEKVHEVTELTVTLVDSEADKIYGTAAAGSDVWVGSNAGYGRSVIASDSGDWVADFSVAAGLEEWEDAYNIQPGDAGTAEQTDNDRDVTWIDWRVLAPAFRVNPNGGVWGWDWEPNSTIDISVGATASPDCTATAQTGDDGSFGTGLDYELAPSDLVTVSDGTTTKWTYVTDLTVEGVNPDNDTVWGSAMPGSSVRVDVYGWAWRDVVADITTGEWTADFTDPPAAGQGDGVCDLDIGTQGGAGQYDSDGDGTEIGWRVRGSGFKVNPHDENVWGWDWEPNSTVDISVGATESPDYTTSLATDEMGNFGTGLEYDVTPGALVTVSDSFTTRSTVVTTLTVDGVDPEADSVWGTAEAGAELQVDINNTGVWRTTTADGSGYWIVDFTEPVGEDEDWQRAFDIGRGTEGEASQYDEDRDATSVPWRVPDTGFNVNPNDESVWGWDWAPNSTVDISVGATESPDHTAIAFTDEWGNFGTGLDGYDLIVGETVTISDGTTTKSTVVTALTVDGVDPDYDMVWGHAAPGGTVQVDAWGMAWRQVTADESTGEWYADFSIEPLEGEGYGTCEIDRGTEGEASQPDEDGDATAMPWRVPNTAFKVNPNDESVWGWDWEPGSTVDIAVGDPEEPTYSISAETDEWGNFGTGLEYDITVEDTVTVSGGESVKSTVVTSLTLDGFNPDTDTVWGTAEAGTEVQIDITNTGVWRTITADVNGYWMVDFTDAVGNDEDWQQGFDIGPGTDGEASQYDEDWDATCVQWRVPATGFNVNPNDESVWGWEWALESVLEIKVGDPEAPDHTAYVTASEWGDFGTNLDYDLIVGETVTISDGTTTKSTVATALTVTGVDPENDTVSGTAAPGSTVQVDAWGMAWRQVTADEFTGEWYADFSIEPLEGEGYGTCEIDLGTEGEASQPDTDGDGTSVPWRVPDTAFRVNPDTDEVWGWDWVANSTVDITVGDPGEPDHSVTVEADEWSNFATTLEYDITVGETVTVEQGSTLKDTIVASLTVDGIDPDEDTVWGTAAPNSVVQVDIYGDWTNAKRWVTADGSGNWSVDFTDAVGDDEDWQQGFDIGMGTQGSASRIDEDNAGTEIGWRVPATAFSVNPNDESVWGWEWAPESVLEIKVGDPEAPDHTAYVTASEWGDFGTNLDYDLIVGETVTIRDGTTTKSTVATALTVTGVDPENDTVSGTAAPRSTVQVDAWGMAWRQVTADEFTGEWYADFSIPALKGEGDGICEIDLGTEGEARQTDEDGDNTAVSWRVPNPHFLVDPYQHSIEGWDWAPNSSAEIAIGNPVSPDATATVETDEWGSFGLWDYGFALEAGDLVTVTDGAITKDHIVTNLTVGGVDYVSDIVTGTAEPGSWVQVEAWNWDSDEWASRWVVADGTGGEWTADFKLVNEDEPWPFDLEVHRTMVRPQQQDENNDGTWILSFVSLPKFAAYPEDDMVSGHEWAGNSTVDIAVGDPGSPDATATVETDPWGNFETILDCDLVSGDLVTVTDGESTKTHTVTELVVDGVDPEFDTVSGTAEAGTEVLVRILADEDTWVDCTATADGVGVWTADFSDTGGVVEPYDIVAGTQGQAEQYDEEDDSTVVTWRISAPWFSAGPLQDYVDGYDWTPLSTVEVSIGETGTTLVTTLTADESGTFECDLAGHDLVPGELVTVNDGVSEKTHRVTPLVVSVVNIADDTVEGTTTPGAWVDVRVQEGDWPWPYRGTNADFAGNWSVDFSVAEEGIPGSEKTVDIIDGTFGLAGEPDDDGDVTTVEWIAETPPVNDAPVAVADSYTATEDTARSVAAPGVLLNDTDTEGDDLTAIKVSDPAHGTVVLSEDGSFVYTPASNYSGADSFTYKANDGTSDSNTATVSITVTAVNDAPVAVADSYTATEDTARSVSAAAGVLLNDTDTEDDDLTAIKVSDPAHGTVTLSDDGSFVYTPTANYTGADSFTYKANDGTSDSNTVTVSITVSAVERCAGRGR